MEQIKDLLRAILSTSVNKFTGGDDPALKLFVDMLSRLPKTAVIAALKEYYAFPPGNFYDHSHMMKLLQRELARELGYKSASEAWEIIQYLRRTVGVRQTPITPAIVTETLDYYGGWVLSVDKMTEQGFMLVYQDKLDKITKKIIMEALNE